MFINLILIELCVFVFIAFWDEFVKSAKNLFWGIKKSKIFESNVNRGETKMTCKDCVHYEACLDWYRGFKARPNKCEHFKDKSKFIELLSADVAPVRHGKWIFNDDWWEFICTNCHKGIGNIKKYPFCPNCGARMNEEE